MTTADHLVGVIGHPVAHSKSPLLHEAAFAELGLDWRSVAFDIPAGQGAAAVTAIGVLGLAGVSVTMPLKEEVAVAVAELTPVAARLQAVNCLVVRDGQVLGDSTDGDGLVANLEQDEGVRPAGLRCAVLGAGGAARAVVDALGRAGAQTVTVIGRTPARAAAAAALAGPAGRVGTIGDVAGADLVVHATPVGLGADEATVRAAAGGEPSAAAVLPVPPTVLHDGQVVVDLVYHPTLTPLLAAAARRGAHVVGGLGMLVHQAALAIERWTGRPAPLAAMWSAVGGQRPSGRTAAR